MGALFEEIPLTFHQKPLLIAGGAMEYHGIRKRGNDYDFVVSLEDFFTLYADHPKGYRKNDLGDEVITVGVYEFSASFAGLSYEQLVRNALKQENYLIISVPLLLFTTFMLAQHEPDSPKRKRDVSLLLRKLIVQYP